MKRRLHRLLGIAACLLALHAPEAGAARKRKAVAPPPAAESPYPVWRQNQGYWANLALHGMSGTIGQYGCAVTAVAMQLRGMGKTLDGRPVDPAVLNSRIQVLTLESMADVAGLRAREVDDVDAALAQGPLIVQIRYHAPRELGGGIGPHYVLLTGKDARGRYVVHDPLVGRRSLDPRRSALDTIEHAYQLLPRTEPAPAG